MAQRHEFEVTLRRYRAISLVERTPIEKLTEQGRLERVKVGGVAGWSEFTFVVVAASPSDAIAVATERFWRLIGKVPDPITDVDEVRARQGGEVNGFREQRS